RRDVHLVEDELHHHVGAGERGSDNPRITVMERSHRVEEVRDAADAEVERRFRLLCGRVRVAERDGDLAAEEPLDDRACTGQLRSERDESYRPRIEETLE